MRYPVQEKEMKEKSLLTLLSTRVSSVHCTFKQELNCVPIVEASFVPSVQFDVSFGKKKKKLVRRTS